MINTGWPNVTLGEILSARQEKPSEDDLLSGRIRIVSKISFADGRISFRPDGQTKTGMILVRPGDLLVSGINAYKGAIGIYDTHAERPAAATIHYAAYAIKSDRAEPQFLFHLLRSDVFRDVLGRAVPGGIKTELKTSRLLRVAIPLPALPEQRRIVARIEELAAKIIEAFALRQQAIGETESLVSRAASAALDDDLWESGRLGDILVESPRNGLSPKPQVETAGRPMLRINAVSSSPNRFVDLNAYKKVEVSDNEARPYVLQHEDVFIVRYNGDLNRVAKAAIFKGETNAVFPDKLMRLRPHREKMTPDFLVYALGCRRVRRQIEDLGKTTAGQIGGSGTDAKSFIVPVPPLPEQHRIVAYLDSLQAKVDALKTLQAETAAELDALLPSILDKALKGEL